MLDDIDQSLIAELRRDGRAPVSDLAHRLKLSRATVRARMERLAARGEIAGFTVLTRADVSVAPVRGLMSLGIEGRGTEKTLRRLRGLPAVHAVHSTNGRWDLIVELGARTLEEFDLVLSQIRQFEGVVASETSLMLTTYRTGSR